MLPGTPNPNWIRAAPSPSSDTNRKILIRSSRRVATHTPTLLCIYSQGTEKLLLIKACNPNPQMGPGSTEAELAARVAIQAQLPHRNEKRFRGGLVFKAHRWLYRSTLDSRVIKKKRKVTGRTRPTRCA